MPVIPAVIMPRVTVPVMVPSSMPVVVMISPSIPAVMVTVPIVIPATVPSVAISVPPSLASVEATIEMVGTIGSSAVSNAAADALARELPDPLTEISPLTEVESVGQIAGRAETRTAAAEPIGVDAAIPQKSAAARRRCPGPRTIDDRRPIAGRSQPVSQFATRSERAARRQLAASIGSSAEAASAVARETGTRGGVAARGTNARPIAETLREIGAGDLRRTE